MFKSEAEAQAHVDQQIADAKVQQAKALGMIAEMESLRVTGRSRDGEIEVVLGQSGGLLDVTIHPRAQGLDAPALQSAILQANSAAQQQLVGQVRQLAEEAYGKDSGTAAAFVGNYERSFPPPTPDVQPPSDFGGRGPR